MEKICFRVTSGIVCLLARVVKAFKCLKGKRVMSSVFLASGCRSALELTDILENRNSVVN